jgi:hypothetical protein
VPPSPEYTPHAISRDAARIGLIAVRAHIVELAPRIGDADPRMTVRHPALGDLNAPEWFALGAMHLRHHLRGQLHRLLRA